MILRSTRKLPLLAGLASIAVIGAILVSGCSGDSDSEAADNAAVLNAIDIMDTAGLHATSTSINEEKVIPATARTTALHLQAITLLTRWPDELEADAKALAAIFGEMAEVLTGDAPDMTRAGELAEKAHDAEHDFSGEVWNHLYEEAGLESEAEGH